MYSATVRIDLARPASLLMFLTVSHIFDRACKQIKELNNNVNASDDL